MSKFRIMLKFLFNFSNSKVFSNDLGGNGGK